MNEVTIPGTLAKRVDDWPCFESGLTPRRHPPDEGANLARQGRASERSPRPDSQFQ